MPTNFSLRKLFKSPRSKRVGNPEVQCEAETSKAAKRSRPRNPSVTTSVDEDNTKVAASSVTKPRDPPKVPGIIDAQVPRSVLPVTNAQAGPAGFAKETQPATESVVRRDLPLSQKLWNDAYDRLEEDNAELVNAYNKTLVEVLVDKKLKDLKVKKAADTSAAKANDVSAERKKVIAEILNDLRDPKVKKATDTSVVGASDVPAELEKLRADVSAQLRDQTKRQIFMKKLVEEGQAKSAKASKITEAIGDAAQSILSVITTVNPVIQNIPQAAPAALPLAGACVALKILSKPGEAARSSREGITHIVSTMKWYCALTDLLDEKNIVTKPFQNIQNIRQLLEERVIELYRAILLYQMKSVCTYYRKQGWVFFRALLDLDKWNGDLGSVTDAENVVRDGSKQYNEELAQRHLRDLDESAKKMKEQLRVIHQDLREFIYQQQKIQEESENKECLRDLRVVNPQDDMRRIENEKEKLFDDAYKWIIEDDKYAAFTNWDESDLPPCRLLWVNGHAGTGKTMLLIGIIRELSDQPAVLAPTLSYFLCQGQGKTDQPLNTATATLRSLIWMLLIQQPCLISHLQMDYGSSRGAVFTDKNTLVAMSRVFENMVKDARRVYFIVDALDECDQGLEDLIKLISTSLTLSDKVRWLVSSRPEVDVLSKLKNLNISRIIDLNSQGLDSPVNAYIEHKLSTLKGKRGYTDIVLAEVSDEVRRRAENIFLWVALVFKKLGKVHGLNAIKIIKEMPPGLSKLYDHMMTRIENVEMIDPQDCKKVLVAISLAYRPLTLPELTVLASLPPEITQTAVEECGSFLTVKEETVHLIHQSAKDYLENDLKKNHESELQQGGAVQGHADISRRSISAMSKLRKDIYDLSHLGSELKDISVPSQDPLDGLQYSCVYWAQHVCQVYSQLDLYQSVKEPEENAFDLHDNGDVHRFLKEHFLHWLETLSLMGKVSLCAPMIIELEKLAPKPSKLYDLVYDAKRFFLKFRSVIELAPLQIYNSALLFSPQTSIIRNLFQRDINSVRISSGVEQNWSPILQTLEGHSHSVSSVAFSPDGSKLASGSGDHTVRVWDVATGQAEHTFEGHSGWVESVAFSPDGSKLASGSHNDTIQVWDVATGQAEHTLKGHSSSVSSIAFSPDGSKLASGSHDYTVRIWDVATGQAKYTLKGYLGWVSSVVFSPDGSKLASGSGDCIVQVWDITTGQVKHTLEGHSDSVSSIAFSPDGSKLASGSGDGTVRVWDVATGQAKHTLKGYSHSVSSVAFSPDGSKLVSGSHDCTVQVWDVATGQAEHTLKGYSHWVSNIAFSPDGSKLAAGSGDHTVRVWDVATGQAEHTLEGYLGWVSSIAFSPDGSKLASGSGDGTVRVWDVATGQVKHTLEGHSDWVSSVAFSPDGSKLASGSHDDTVRVWDVATGQAEHTLKGHLGWVSSITFSPDGRKLASGSHDDTVRLWDVVTGQAEHTLEGHLGRVNSVAFSPNRSKLASGSHDNTVRVWDVATGQAKHTLKGHSGSVSSVTFSPNGSKLASGSHDYTIQVWDVATGQAEHTLKGHSDWVSSVTFSPDGSKLASGSHDYTIQVWDVATGQAEHTLEGHSGSVSSVTFSPYGSKLDLCQQEAVHYCVRSRSFYSVDKSGYWVTQNGLRTLYLPVDHRPGCLATKGSNLAIGSSTGRVTIITFSDVKTRTL